ncbi:hypothetical protein BDA96_04G201800 [Sorghum bicolor]|uniref:Uncharacterized protein n=1 Tax=Sorghum bicolor TaxID=4558 RepID=A0A921R5D2_SORBI|nr:hypothetical protein BDA96_04G201800 [Sorghum bicolor]
MMSDGLLQQVAIILLQLYICIFFWKKMVPIILEDGRIHMSSDGRAVDQLLHQHSMAGARPLGRIWSWKIKLIRIQWGCFIFRSRWATNT